jgi:gluconolactonase
MSNRSYLLSPLLLAASLRLPAQMPATADSQQLVSKIQDELGGPLLEDGKPHAGTPRGEFLHGTIADSKIYPGTTNDFQVYVPAQYDPAQPACLLVKLDGIGPYEATVLDNLIAKKQLPVIVGIGVTPGAIWRDPPVGPKRRAFRFDRSYEFDSVNDLFPDFVLNELLPAAQQLKTHDGRAVRLSSKPNDRAVTGGSTGGIGSFTLAWRRPDQFSRVYSVIGTFVSMRGGHEYPALIRKTEPKPIRIFLEDGSADAWNPLFGSWFEANLNMASALEFAGYDVAHAWGTHGHDGHPGQVILPDVLRWLWRDYPAPVKSGRSNNSTLQEITQPEADWVKIPQSFTRAAGLAANAQGEVYFSDLSQRTIYRLGEDSQPVVFSRKAPVAAQAFGPDGDLYGIVPGESKVVKLDPKNSAVRIVATGIAGHGITVTNVGTAYISEPGAHSDEPSRIWQIATDGQKKLVDQGLLSASGLAFSPDGALFFAAESTSKWIYSFVVTPGGSPNPFEDKQRFYWLHMTDIPNNSGAEDLAVDTHGNLYVATRMGVQVCDQNGRVRAILPLPSPSGPARSLCFGGPRFDVLYATDGRQIFKRRLKVPGHAPWAPPVSYPSQGPG